MRIVNLSAEERGRHFGAQSVAIIDTDDLTETTAATEQTINLNEVPEGALAAVYSLVVETGLADGSDSAFDDVTVSVGESGTPDVDAFVTAQQVASNNASPIVQNGGTGSEYIGDAADQYLTATFTPEAGKSLSDLDAGEIHVFFTISDKDAP